MLLIPAIDLKDGHCVRLQQGDMNESTIFSDNPRRWRGAGRRRRRRLHLVDLNGAFAGKPVNESAVKAILAEVGDEIPVQLGGGIRDLDTIERYLDDGLSFIIIGTAAVKNPGFMRDACSAFGGHIIVGLDARTARSRPTAGASSPATRSPTWRRSSRTTASRDRLHRHRPRRHAHRRQHRATVKLASS
jgi:phosphoribosylformimino-5-aminoimidazole carboxamide ribotide isomerase